ncbi:hypothetical protein ZIOFF_013240 [Zingiber officinale]|uniref:Uncharacterized protein n=1 Tax=Zingiber officinale TaxID=94328 RepID=A0A8J5HU26_ZINOF|nr:hypothetical protein ZIOFF_013240 [Zingiber officinale]
MLMEAMDQSFHEGGGIDADADGGTGVMVHASGQRQWLGRWCRHNLRIDKMAHPHFNNRRRRLMCTLWNMYGMPIVCLVLKPQPVRDDREEDMWKPFKGHFKAKGLFNVSFPYFSELEMVYDQNKATSLVAEDPVIIARNIQILMLMLICP